MYYLKYIKVKDGYKVVGFQKVFKTLTALKNYYNRTSQVKVKFIKGY